MTAVCSLWSIHWGRVILALNAVETAQAAVVSDRFPREHFGVASGSVAMGIIVGMGMGLGFAGFLVNCILVVKASSKLPQEHQIKFIRVKYGPVLKLVELSQ